VIDGEGGEEVFSSLGSLAPNQFIQVAAVTPGSSRILSM
jgi:hypothetical protein